MLHLGHHSDGRAGWGSGRPRVSEQRQVERTRPVRRIGTTLQLYEGAIRVAAELFDPDLTPALWCTYIEAATHPPLRAPEITRAGVPKACRFSVSVENRRAPPHL